MPSRLEKIVHSLCEVVLSYSSTQTLKPYSLKELLEKEHEKFIEALQSIINDGTKGYTTRLSLLNYFLFVINQVKPLLVQNKPMSNEECIIVQQHLENLILNVNKLLNTYQNQTIVVNYNDKKENIYGFVRGISGMHKAYTLCNSGQLLQDNFITPLGLTEYSKNTVNSFVAELIDEHQRALKLLLLNEENTTLKKQFSELEERFKALEEEKLSLEVTMKQLQQEKQRTDEALEQLNQEKLSLMAELKLEREKTTEKSKPSSIKRSSNMNSMGGFGLRPYYLSPFFPSIGLPSLLEYKEGGELDDKEGNEETGPKSTTTQSLDFDI
ncbi:Uncharacterised protein [Legionella lansingensis]|uniref:Uncharacterized protein n=1 Tax=Legionella lansingensis TaxID=45067 RepID=A0A0W0VXN5_9GAMM|nr:hypothetical protein [Legionella lansingensis]KTD24794.1 hypothetical protein Llan_0356 [Legionella lansingensis]SNV48984.1 Uncharacterised protein [Legionella lansingensis]